MSESSIVAIVAIGASGVVSLATVGLHLWNANLERTDKYRLVLYEKRLDVHQQAYRWLMALIQPLQRAADLTTGDRALPDNFVLFKLYQDAREWWDGNCLYLDEVSRVRVIDFIELASEYLEAPPPPERERLFPTYRIAITAVQEGLGMKHLEQAPPRRVTA